MIGDDFLLVVRENGVFLLVAGDDHFDALFQVRLGCKLPSVTHRTQRGLVDNIGQLRAGGARRHAGNLQKVHVIRDLDFLRMHLQDGFAPFQVRKLHGDTAVKTAGPGQGRIQRFRPVGCRQNDDAGIAVEAVHLRQELVERLLPLVISAHATAAAALLSDGVDFVDKDDAGRFLLGLAEQVAHLGRAHADKHLDKFRSRHGEKRHIRLARNGLGEHRLAGSRRADQQNALWHLGADLAVFLRIFQILDDLLEVFFRLVHAFHIAEANAVRRFHIDLRVGLAHIEHQGSGSAAGLVHHLFGQDLAQDDEHPDRQKPGEQEGCQRRSLFHNLAGKLSPGGMESFHKTGVFHQSGSVKLGVIFIGKDDLIALNLDLADLLILRHGHERSVIHFGDRLLRNSRRDQRIEQEKQQQNNQVEICQRQFRLFYFFHNEFHSDFCFSFRGSDTSA